MYQEKHIWSDKDETICCYEYLKYSLKNNYSKEYTIILDKLSNLLPDIPKNSIKMKLQNIKFLCESRGIPDFVELKSLCNASTKNHNVFSYLIQLPEIEKLIKERKNELAKYKIKATPTSLDDIRKIATSFKNTNF